MKKILAMILVLCMALTLASAAVAESKSPVDGMTVAFIPKVSGNSFFEAANDGAQKYAAEWGLTVDYIGSPDASVTSWSSSSRPSTRAWTPSASPPLTPPLWTRS
jgi:ABC-type sugar transport system substrate-binding protein